MKIYAIIGIATFAILSIMVYIIYDEGRKDEATKNTLNTYEADRAAIIRKDSVPIADSISVINRLSAGTF